MREYMRCIRSIGSTDETGKGYQQFPGVMSFERIDVLPSVSEVILNSSKTNMSIGEHAVLMQRL